MSLASQPGKSDRVARAIDLNKRLTEFATSGELGDEFDRHCKILKQVPGELVDSLGEVLEDWFIFDWPGSDGNGVLGEFLQSNPQLGKPEQRLLLEWAESLPGIFAIHQLDMMSALLTEVGSDQTFAVVLTDRDRRSEMDRGQFIVARLLEVGDGHIFSRPPVLLSDAGQGASLLEVRDAVASVNSPEFMEKLRLEQRQSFVECFGADEITMTAAQVGVMLEAFRGQLLAMVHKEQALQTTSSSGIPAIARVLALPEISWPAADISPHDEVTALFDEFEGLVILPQYRKFQQIFQSDDPERDVPGWRDLVWSYIKDPLIPLLAFEYVAEKSWDQMESVLRDVLGDDKFSGKHLYAMLLHYKDPVTGLDTLEDDERLWDLLDGSDEPHVDEPGLARHYEPHIFDSSSSVRRKPGIDPLPASGANKEDKGPGGQKRAGLTRTGQSVKPPREPRTPKGRTNRLVQPDRTGNASTSASNVAKKSSKGTAKAPGPSKVVGPKKIATPPKAFKASRNVGAKSENGAHSKSARSAAIASKRNASSKKKR